MIPIRHADVRPQSFPAINGWEIESHTPRSGTHVPPFEIECIISVTRGMERISAHRGVTISAFIQMFMRPDCDIDIERLLQVFREVREIDIHSDTPAQQLGPLMKCEPLSLESIAQSKPALRLDEDEKKVLEKLMDFLVQNNWCIPWMEESTGRFVGIEQPLYRTTPLLINESFAQNVHFPVGVLQVVSSKRQTGTVNSTPRLLPSNKSELKSMIGHHKNVSICLHTSRADGSVRRSPAHTWPVFNGRCLQKWCEARPRLQHLYVQFVPEHTDEFPLRTVTFDFPISIRTNLRYSPPHSV